MTDIIDGLGALISDVVNIPYAGQEPQDKDTIPTSGIVIIERVGGPMTQYARSDKPWIQFTVLAGTKKRAFDLLREIRQVVSAPRAWVGGLYVYGVREVLNVEEASLVSDPFYRVRCGFEFHTKGLA